MDPFVVLIIAALLTVLANFKIRAAYLKYMNIRNGSDITGADAAEMFLSRYNLNDVTICPVSGQLTDNYDPINKTLGLSHGVYESNSVSALCITAHECGHACQHEEGYGLLRFRNKLVPVVSVCSSISWGILLIGLVLGVAGLYDLGIILFSVCVLFHLVTLPIEINASKRGLKMLQECGLIVNAVDMQGSKKVLSAAALTYVASLAMSIANLIRLLSFRNRNHR